MANFFDQFDDADGGKTGNYFDQFDDSADGQPSAKQNTSLAGDLGTDLKRGVQKLPGIAAGLADIPVAALTNKRFVDETADKVGELTGFQPSQWAEEARDEYSPERQAGTAEIDQAWEDGSAMDIAGAYASNPGNVAGLVAESLPQMLAGGVIGRGALAAGRAAGVVGAPTTAAQAATQSAIAGGVGEGAVIAGGTMDQIDDSVEPRRAAAASAGAGVAGAALGVLGAKAAQRMGVLDAESAIAGGAGQVAGEAPGLARRVAGGALTEGVLEELPQSAAETVIQNWAEEKDLTEGLARAAVEGTLAGSAIGAGVNVLPARKRSEEMGLDPNAGPLSAAAVTAVDSEQALLPAPERLALPAPDQTLYADGQGNVSEQGPTRDVDREQRPVPGREQPVRDFGPGMEQQVERGIVPVAGELMPAVQPDAPAQESAEPRTFDVQPERQGIPDLRESSINVDAAGNAVPGKIPTPRPADYVQGGRGMDQQAPVGKTYSNVLAAKNAIQRAGSADVLEAVQVGPKQFEVRAIAPPAASQEAPVVEPAPVQPSAADAVSAAPVAPAVTPAAKPAPVKTAPQPVDRKGLPEILRHPKKMVITRMAKAAGIKKGSPGYDAAVGRLESEYERQVDDAQAALPFEQFNALNKESPEGVNRQAWTQLRKERGIDTEDAPAAPKVKPIKGADIDGDWASFSKDSGTLSVPRAEMPQIKAEHRGAMVNFLNARGVAHAEETIAADQLKPTQAEYSTKKVEAAKAFEGGDRSILISRDGHVLDGHHQWLAKRDAGEDVKVIRLDAPIRELLDTVAEFPSATVDQASAPAASSQPKAQAAKVEDFGEKIGGARKDTATSGKKKVAKEADSRPAWQRRYEVTQVVTSTTPGEAGRWVISDTRKLDWNKRPKQLRGNYATEEEAMQMLPVIAVAQKHRVLSVRDGDGTGFEIWRDVTDRKRVKVVDQVFPSREAGMEYMARNAKAIIETNTTFGEADLPRPDSTVRQGAERRTGPVKDSAFTEAFGFRGVEFGNWNNQEERQQLLDDAYDGLMDLAEVMGIPPRAISLNGDLALAFGARGQGLSGARAHYEPGKVVINLTKMNGAGSLAHEWFHALDHYFARQDGKSSSAWAVDKDGTRSLKITSNFENDAASSGFLRNNSGVREVLRDAYTDLMKTMFSKGETYVEDTARVDEFVGRSRKELTDRLDEIRRDLAEQKDPRYWKRNNKPASAEQLAEFDTVAQLVRDGTALSTELRPTPGKSRSVLTSMRWTNDALEKMSEIYKAVRGRTGFNAENNGVFDRLRQTMGAYSSRLKMLADAQNGQEKVKKVPTQFAMDAKELDQGRGTDYWTTPHEMAARAFQGYVEDRIAERGGQSPFLNFGPENVGILTPWGWKRPFPAGEERQSINRAFDKLIGVIQTRETEGGNVALYSRASYRQGQAGEGSRAVQLRLQLKRLIGGWQNAPDIKVVQSIKDLPDAQRRQVERDGAFDVEGMFADGQVYLVADNLRDVKHAAFVLQHEVLGHAGLQGAYGKRLTPLLMSLYNSNAELKSQADALVQRFGYQPAVAMEEVLADMAAAETIQEQAFWPRLLTAMRNALRSIGFRVDWNDGDIQGLLANARRYIRSGTRKGRGRSVYSRNGSSGRLVEMVDEKGRLLAPNGKPSKLNQKQWHQVRSENFKRWFGDWQAANAQERLDAVKPLKLRMPEAWKDLNERERLAKVEESLKGMAKLSEPLPHRELGEVVMGMSGAKKSASSAADPAKQAILSRLQSAFEHSIYASSSLDQNAPSLTAYHKLLAPIDVDGVPLVAVFTVREDANGRMFYNTVAVDRKEEAPAVSPGDMSNKTQRSTPANTRAPADFVRQPLQRVNPDDVSAVIDGSGEPLVLYHGTAEQFTVFDQSRAGRSTGHSTAPLGIFLTADAKLAHSYAEKATDGMPGLANVLPLFASIKKPYRMSLAESQALDSPQKAIAFRQKLESDGYDGVQLQGSPVWVAFYNSQVKSATNNTGAFDEVDPDIRYSRASQRDTEALRKLGLAGTDAQNLLDQVRNVTLGGLQAKLSEWATRSEEGLFDGLAGIRRAEEAVGVTDAEKQGYVSARMASGIADVMHGVLHYAAPEWRDGVIAGKADTRGVLEILGDLGQDNLTPWLAWLGGKRAQMLKAQGRENNLTDTEIAELIAMGKGKEALFEKVYQDYAKVNEAVLDLAEQAGLIDQSARAKWATEYYVPFYRVDESEGLFSGPRSKKGLSHQSAAIKALKGGTLPTNDLLTNMLAGWTKRIDASMKNKALLEVVDNLQGSQYLTDESPRYQQVLISRSQIADQIRKDRKALAMAAEMLGLPAESKFLKVANQLMKPENEGFEQLWTRVAPTDPDIIRVQRDGKNEYYRVNDESLLRGLKFMEGSVFNDPITRIGRTFKRLLTTGVTASPDFILRNFIRDAAHAWMINKDGFVLGKDSIKGMRDALREDQDYRDLMFAGGSFQGGYVHGTDPEASAQIIRRALEKKGFTSEQQSAYLGSLVNTPAKVAGMLGKGWQAYRTLGDKVENANRLSTYKAALAAGKSPRQAAYEAKDLMDYSLRGNFAAAQWFTDVVPFLNARMQGLYKLGRAVKGDKTLIAKEVAMKGGYIALFSLLLAGLNDDDERYQALMDWDKDMHWHIFLGDQHFRIPKPFELGLVFGTVPERLLHTLTGTQDGGDLAKAVSQGVFQTLAFNPVPQFYQPIRELQANRNFFRDSPIEDMSDEGKLPEARFDERTSALGRVLGQVTGPTLGLSPKQLDHLVQGYTGTLGGYVLGMSSLIASAFDGVDSPTTRASDLPVLKVLYQGDAVRSTQYQSEFYDMMQEADQLHRTVKAYRDEGKVEAAAKLLEGNSDKLKHRPALGLARQQLGAVRRQMDAVYRDTAMDGDAKRRRLEELQTRSNQIAERVVRLAGKDF